MLTRSGALRRVILALAMVVIVAGSSFAQERRNLQTAGVDNTKMGPYRASAHWPTRLP
jgi:hypothetical protein